MGLTSSRYRTAGHVDATRFVSRYTAHLFQQRAATGSLCTGVEVLKRQMVHQMAGAVRDYDSEYVRQQALGEALGREVFAGLYDGEVQRLDKPAAGTEIVQKCHDMLAELPEAQALAQQVMGDPDLSAIATARLLQGVAQALPRIAEEQRKQQKQQSDRRRNRGPQADPDGVLRRALRGAASQASQDAADIANGLGGVQPGLGETPPLHEHDGTDRYSIADRVSNDPRLAKIMRLAGRLRREQQQSKMTRGVSGRSSVVGVECGDDIGRVLPIELARMRPGSRLRKLTLARWANKRLQQYRMTGEEPQGRGPIVIMLDESGSMLGDNADWAAAITLACLGIAGKEKRPCTVIGFNRRVRYILRLDAKGKAWEHDAFDLADASKTHCIGSAVNIALRVATSSPRGGTTFDAPFHAALDMEDGAGDDRADLVLITDGRASVSSHTYDRVKMAKDQGGTRVYGLTVGGGSLGMQVCQLCDTTVDLDSAVATNDSKQVASVLP